MRCRNNSLRDLDVLLVEDDPLLLEVMTAALSRSGYGVEIARTGDEAIELAHALKPRIVLLDIDLPGQSGYLVAAKLKLMPTSPRVIFSTALPRGQSDRVAAFLGVDAILHKPFGLQKLFSAIDQLLEVARAA